MKGYGQFCPVAKAAEIVAERWTPLVLRELICGSTRFSELRRGVPLMSPSLLTQRLRELGDAGILERKGEGRTSEYLLTEAGRELEPIIIALGHWGKRWVGDQLGAQDYDPSLLMWDLRRRIDAEYLPAERRIVVQFDFTGTKPSMRRWWLVAYQGDMDLCFKDPGHEVTLYLSGHIRALTDVWQGRISMNQALRTGSLTLEGPRQIAADFRRSLKLSMFASA